MKQLKAKFKVGSTQNFGNGNVQANLTAVTGDSEENKTYSMYTPRADASIHITNPDALDFFEAGAEYVAVFTRADDLGKEVFWPVEESAKEKRERYKKDGVKFSNEPLINMSKK